MDAERTPKDVVRRFLEHGMKDGQWDMEVIDGREVTVQHVEMWRVTGGKIVEHWGGLGAGHQLYRELTV